MACFYGSKATWLPGLSPLLMRVDRYLPHGISESWSMLTLLCLSACSKWPPTRAAAMILHSFVLGIQGFGSMCSGEDFLICRLQGSAGKTLFSVRESTVPHCLPWQWEGTPFACAAPGWDLLLLALHPASPNKRTLIPQFKMQSSLTVSILYGLAVSPTQIST